MVLCPTKSWNLARAWLGRCKSVFAPLTVDCVLSPRPVVRFQGLVVQNTFLGEDFSFYYLFKINFSRHNIIWGAQKNLGGIAPECYHLACIAQCLLFLRSCIIRLCSWYGPRICGKNKSYHIFSSSSGTKKLLHQLIKKTWTMSFSGVISFCMSLNIFKMIKHEGSWMASSYLWLLTICTNSLFILCNNSDLTHPKKYCVTAENGRQLPKLFIDYYQNCFVNVETKTLQRFF